MLTPGPGPGKRDDVPTTLQRGSEQINVSRYFEDVREWQNRQTHEAQNHLRRVLRTRPQTINRDRR